MKLCKYAYSFLSRFRYKSVQIKPLTMQIMKALLCNNGDKSRHHLRQSNQGRHKKGQKSLRLSEYLDTKTSRWLAVKSLQWRVPCVSSPCSSSFTAFCILLDFKLATLIVSFTICIHTLSSIFKIKWLSFKTVWRTYAHASVLFA